MNEAPIELLHKLFTCDAQAGLLFWKPRENANPWNARYAHMEAFCSPGKYLRGNIDGKAFPAHRVIWAMHYGAWPKNQIDHINGDSRDNRIVNLRDVTTSVNAQNTKLMKNNKSGVCGVYWRVADKRWIARICVNRKIIDLGRFTQKQDAIARRKAAELEYGFHPNHGRISAVRTVGRAA